MVSSNIFVIVIIVINIINIIIIVIIVIIVINVIIVILSMILTILVAIVIIIVIIVIIIVIATTTSPSAYAQQLEDMIAEKQEQLATLRERTRAFRECLNDEEVQSNKMNQNRRH